jgi:hypothetical protein
MNKPPANNPFDQAIGLHDAKPKNVVARLMMEGTMAELRTMSHLIEILGHYSEIEDARGFLMAGAKCLDEARSLAKKLKDLERYGLPAEPS